MKRTRCGVALACALLIASTASAEESAMQLTWSVGVETTQGDYGTDANIEDLYIPLTMGVEGRKYSLRVTVPYVSFSGPVELAVSDPEAPIPDAGLRATESGLGDVIAGLTLYDVLYSRRLRLALDLKGKVKFGTADADKGLGTGATDVTVLADLVKFFDNVTVIGSAGYKFRGDPDDIELRNTALASLGGVLRVSDRYRSGLFLDYRESAFAGEDAIVEASLFLARRLENDRSLQFFVYKGFSESSADWGAGFLFQGG